ncbi:alkaline phosphatase [Euryhalocaulis caribicus]|uniref:alkaline phosphatase n=1 Tax=Euryhalocaulis caribicus TaxID=1161401 RepID=UPI0003999626|nr:alkaline phosphatase [Euryhalocaulis caribicus]
MLTTLLLSAAIAGQPAEPPQDYAADARAALSDRLARIPVTGRAKNVIVFVGDGLSISTATAARILDGQLRGVDGESNALSFEKFPYTGLSKTYSHDFQVSDSAATATAIMTGSKTRSGMINVTLDAQPSDCGPDAPNRLQSLAEIAETAGKATGLVSTARITHATPATVYAHVPERDWESDDDVPEGLRESCPDIARQLIEWPAGDGLELAMGGGRAGFLPEDMADPEHEGEFGNRLDGRDLTAEWVEKAGENGAYVWNREQFDALDAAGAPRVLALFEPSHMQYDADRADDPAGEPSLSEMTAKAIDILSTDEDGFFLMVEGGRIDHAHHAGNAYRALTDAVAFSKAVETALSKVDPAETLIVVTADHGHTLTISGYPARGNPILGLAATPAALIKAQDGKPYTTLGYANGPGAVDGERPDLSDVDVRDKDFRQQALVPSGSETHTGDDVPIYAKGPWAHLLTGVVEQNYIFHAMRHAMTYEENAAE